IIIQGEMPSRIGFVRRGEAFEAVSREHQYHILRLRGADFFTIPFPDTDVVRARTPPRKGVVELVSGAGRFWMRGHLFVDEHPYYTRTGLRGGFRLEQVPEGEYELTVWVPNWHVARVEHDPGTNFAPLVWFHPPLEITRKVTVRRGEAARLDVEVSAADFRPR